jgi:hypothetical protein
MSDKAGQRAYWMDKYRQEGNAAMVEILRTHQGFFTKSAMKFLERQERRRSVLERREDAEIRREQAAAAREERAAAKAKRDQEVAARKKVRDEREAVMAETRRLRLEMLQRTAAEQIEDIEAAASRAQEAVRAQAEADKLLKDWQYDYETKRRYDHLLKSGLSREEASNVLGRTSSELVTEIEAAIEMSPIRVPRVNRKPPKKFADNFTIAVQVLDPFYTPFKFLGATAWVDRIDYFKALVRDNELRATQYVGSFGLPNDGRNIEGKIASDVPRPIQYVRAALEEIKGRPLIYEVYDVPIDYRDRKNGFTFASIWEFVLAKVYYDRDDLWLSAAKRWYIYQASMERIQSVDVDAAAVTQTK